MSIEDVDYLYQNSIKESSIILVDSSQRNRDVYHSPNNYTIEFTLPFKYVYGVEVIDSSVPRTMYQIDKFNDTLYFFTSEGGEEFIQLDNRDYSLDDLISAIDTKLKDSSNSTKLRSITPIAVSSPSSDVAKIFFSNSSVNSSDVFYILGFKSNILETLGFDENSINNSTDYVQFTNSDTNYNNIASTSNINTYGTDIIQKKTFKSGIGKGDHGKFEIEVGFSNKQNLQCPGIVNLVGDRYVRLRSNTIEQHLHSSLSADKNPLGLGLFKLGATGYVDSRFDFINVKYRDFHPIGKLASIDFRFETLDNQLYDFKGINHHFLLNIKFYTPIQKRELTDYVLNPNYNPNLIQYKKLQYEKYDSDENVEEVTKDFKNTFLKAEKKYEYSSDEDLDYLSSDNDGNNTNEENDDTEDDSETSETSSNESIQRSNMNFMENRTIFHPTNYEQI